MFRFCFAVCQHFCLTNYLNGSAYVAVTDGIAAQLLCALVMTFSFRCNDLHYEIDRGPSQCSTGVKRVRDTDAVSRGDERTAWVNAHFTSPHRSEKALNDIPRKRNNLR